MPAPHPAQEGEQRADVCIIGGGFTGLGAAVTLGEAGARVVLLERGRIGDGASGRNGGQVHIGLRQDQIWLERRFGLETARQLWQASIAARLHLDRLIRDYAIDCDPVAGLVEADHKPGFVRHSHGYAAHLARVYDYAQIEPLDAEALRAYVRSDDYYGGVLDRGGGHLNPLKLALGTARAAADRGVQIYENSEATALHHGAPAQVDTARGRILADHVIVAGDALMRGLLPQADRTILPIASTVGVTEPLGDRLLELLPTEMAVSDSRFVVNYFRRAGDRLVFGGGESYSSRPVADPAALVRRAMRQVFPALADVRFDHAWSGLVGITPNRLPLMRRVNGNVFVAAGYSGQGVALAPYAGALMGRAVGGDPDGFDLFSALPVPAFPGGRALQQPLLMLAMSYFALRDRL